MFMSVGQPSLVRRLRQIQHCSRMFMTVRQPSSVRHRWVTCVLGIFDHFQYCLPEAFLSETKFDAFSDESHLLTATHCINQYRPEELRVSGEEKLLIHSPKIFLYIHVELERWRMNTKRRKPLFICHGFSSNLEIHIRN